ncbi:MAG: 30S ribosomal protein S17 [Chloroflexi bacterium]|nr:30S ribosomal protein S17 [Chloroflexota bacterium]
MSTIEKLQLGVVVSNKMDKTVVVRVDRSKRHRLYGKTIHTSERYKAHDERNECNLGDVVRISETRPLSRDKRWRVVEVVQKGDVAEVAPTEVGTTQLAELEAVQAAEAARRAEEERQKAAARAEAEAAEAEAKAAAAPADESPAAAPAEVEPAPAAADEPVGDDTPVAEADAEATGEASEEEQP